MLPEELNTLLEQLMLAFRFLKSHTSVFLSVSRIDHAKQSSLGECKARWGLKRQQAQVSPFHLREEDGTHRVRQVLHLPRPVNKMQGKGIGYIS